jgi:hypothetical protein
VFAPLGSVPRQAVRAQLGVRMLNGEHPDVAARERPPTARAPFRGLPLPTHHITMPQSGRRRGENACRCPRTARYCLICG